MTRSVLAGLHIVAGFVALISFWFPPFLKKGGRAHRAFGWTFVGAMSVILTSAAVMSVMQALNGNVNQAMFLGFLTVISFSAVYGGLRVLRAKASPALMLTWDNLAVAVMVLVFSLLLLHRFFFESRFSLLLVFGLVGLFAAAAELVRWVRPPAARPRYWWFDHMRGMITAGMAAHIAFLAFGAGRLWPDLYTGKPWWVVLIPWTSPFVVAFIAIALLERHYTRQFAARSPGTKASTKTSTETPNVNA